MKIAYCLFISLFFVNALAQEGTSSTAFGDIKTEAPKADESASKQKMEKIEVTGSYIKRVDEEGTSPVQTISSETLQKSGQNSVADVLREIAYTQQDQRENSLSSNPGVATAGIGPFGSDSVLVLLDGQRLPKIGGENGVDLNMIPMAAIERVEILKDGASALYGSDAIGGVMNFITKKNYSGAAINLNQNLYSQGGAARSDVSVTVGKTYSRGSIMGVIQYRDNAELTDQDREFSKITNVSAQGSATGNFGSWQDMNVGKNNASTFCPPENQAPGGLCRFDYSKYSWGIPAIQQANALLTGSYKLNDYFKSRTSAMFVRRDVQTQLAPSPDTMRIDKDTAINKLGLNTTGDVLIRYRIADEAGPRQNQDQTNTYNISQTFEGKIAGTWSWDLTGNYGRSVTNNTGTGYADKAKIIQKINDGLFNPFAAPGQKGDITDTLFTSTKDTTSSQSEIKLVTTGQLYDGGDFIGPIAMAMGVATGWQGYSSVVDPITAAKNAYGTVGSFGEGQRNYQSVFQELSIFPVETVEVGLAARYDNYNDFGSTVNPKLSVSWQASDKILLRSSVGTGFRAPNLVDLYNGGSYGFPQMIDGTYCDAQTAQFGEGSAEATAACLNQQQLVNYRSNPNLKQERSIFYNIGFLAQPKKNWNVEGNFWMATVKDRVGTLDPTYVLIFEQEQGAAALAKYGINIPRTPDGQLDPSGISMPSAFNLPSENLQGLDLRVSREAKANIFGKVFDVTITVDHLHMLKSDKEDFPNLGMRRYRDINWRNTAVLGLSRNHHNIRFVTRTVSGGDNIGNADTVGQGSLPTFTTHDIVYSYGNLFGGTLNMGVRNLMAKNQPLDPTQFAPSDRLDATKYDPLGQAYYMGYSYQF